MEYEVAKSLAQRVISVGAFEPVSDSAKEQAAEVMLSCEAVLLAAGAGKPVHAFEAGLIETARQHNMNIVFSAGELQ